MFEGITNQVIGNLKIELKIIVLDGTRFSSDYIDKYYLKIRRYNVKHFSKSHIAIDVESRMILYIQAVKGPRHDTKFAIAEIRSLKNITSIHNSRQ